MRPTTPPPAPLRHSSLSAGSHLPWISRHPPARARGTYCSQSGSAAGCEPGTRCWPGPPGPQGSWGSAGRGSGLLGDHSPVSHGRRSQQPAPLCSCCPHRLRLPRPANHLCARQLPPLLGALATDVGQIVTVLHGELQVLRGELQVLREHSQRALWGHDPGRTTPPIPGPSKAPLRPWTQGQ